MIKYTTKDLIKRAEQLTDFTSSDFISIREKINLLNDSFVIVYQALINANDKTFIKNVTLQNGEQLPKDLYQIHLVSTHSGVLTKKTSPSQTVGYDIINNCIVGDDDIYNLSYWANPKTLYLKDDTIEDLNISKSCLIYNDTYYAVKESNTLTMYNTANNNSLKSQNDTAPIFCHLANGIVNLTSKTFTPYGSTSSYNFDCLMIKGNTATLDKVISDNLNSNCVLFVTDQSEEQAFFINNNYEVFTDSEMTKKVETLSANSLFYCRQDGLYYAEQNSQYLQRLSNNIVEWLPLPIWSFICFSDDTHILVTDGSEIKRTGFGFDTLLEHPNNIFYTYLAYDLAISMCSVVNRDSTALESKADEIRASLFNSIVQDVNEVYTIKDVNQVRSSIYGN